MNARCNFFQWVDGGVSGYSNLFFYFLLFIFMKEKFTYYEINILLFNTIN